ncbi:MAG: hypothetical protein ACREQW_07505 [Candidatus Binatia bacterium]
MTLEVIGFVIGIIGAIWMKSAMGLLEQEKQNVHQRRLGPKKESPAIQAFIRGISLVLAGLGFETFARLFLTN